MIAYVKGLLTEKKPGEIVVESHGVGYAVAVPFSTYQQLPALNEEVKVLTHHHIREDTQKLFGFSSNTEREVFQHLIGVSKIGPKVALSILSHISVPDFIRAVSEADPTRLKGIAGVGPKTAQRLVLELKGKFSNIAPDIVPSPTGPTSTPDAPSAHRDAFDAMVSLGYNERQVEAALQRVREIITPEAPVEEWIRKALQVIG